MQGEYLCWIMIVLLLGKLYCDLRLIDLRHKIEELREQENRHAR